MKKLFLFILLATTFNLFAHFPIVVDTDESRGLISNVDFAPLQVGIGFFENCQLYDGNVNTFISLGGLGLLQKSAVISFAPISEVNKNYFLQCGLMTCTETNYLLTVSLVNLVKHNYGLQIGVGNISTHNSGIQIGMFNTGGFLHNSGIQIGMFNTGGFLQLGLLNYNPSSYIPWLPLVNWDMGREEQ